MDLGQNPSLRHLNEGSDPNEPVPNFCLTESWRRAKLFLQSQESPIRIRPGLISDSKLRIIAALDKTSIDARKVRVSDLRE